MHSLTELRDYLKQQNIRIKEFGGWYLEIGTDRWTLLEDVFYCNGEPRKIKDRKIFAKYDKITNQKRSYPAKKIKSAKYVDDSIEE